MDKIISLTSIPTRFKYLSETIDSLIKQNACNEIRLNIQKNIEDSLIGMDRYQSSLAR